MSELAKPAKKERSVHEGHRSRIKKRFLEKGLDSFEPHEALELLLYYGIPQGDTNPTAHRLLDTSAPSQKSWTLLWRNWKRLRGLDLLVPFC